MTRPPATWVVLNDQSPPSPKHEARMTIEARMTEGGRTRHWVVGVWTSGISDDAEPSVFDRVEQQAAGGRGLKGWEGLASQRGADVLLSEPA